MAVIKDLTTNKKPEDLRGPPVHRKSAGWHESTKIKREGDARQSAQRSGKKEGMDGEKSDSDSDGCNQPFTLMGCNNRAEVDTLSPAQAPN